MRCSLGQHHRGASQRQNNRKRPLRSGSEDSVVERVHRFELDAVFRADREDWLAISLQFECASRENTISNAQKFRPKNDLQAEDPVSQNEL
jgi:hypothetical protein